MPTDPDRNRPDDPVLPYARPGEPLVPTYRKVLAYSMIVAAIPILLYAMMQTNPAARTNIAVPGFALIMWGVVIRFQHVRF